MDICFTSSKIVNLFWDKMRVVNNKTLAPVFVLLFGTCMKNKNAKVLCSKAMDINGCVLYSI